MEDQNPTEGTKIFNAWAQQINYIHVTQTLTLPAGTYKLTGDVRSDRENTTAEGTRLVALVGEKAHLEIVGVSRIHKRPRSAKHR